MRLTFAAQATLILLSSTFGNSNANAATPYSPGFSIQNVISLAISLPSHSWEFGTASEALLQLYNCSLSVFGSSPFSIPTPLHVNDVQSLSYARSKIVFGQGANTLSNGTGAVGDPASLGVSAWLLGQSDDGSAAQYAAAAAQTIRYLISEAPRASNGAISQRVDVVELWADFIYMAPPFLAYYGASTQNLSLLQESVSQCGDYRDTLLQKDGPSAGLWHHIIGPQNTDLGLWSTGNGWAAAGMTRVLATVLKAPIAQSDSTWRATAIANLTTWIKEIVDGAIDAPPDNGLLRNYLNDTVSAHGFGETSGSSLIASVVYRMIVMQPDTFCDSKYIAWADQIRGVLASGWFYQATSQWLFHVDRGNGTVRPAVNPLGWDDVNPYMLGSPEGQNFVVLLYAAWRDCVEANKCEQY